MGERILRTNKEVEPINQSFIIEFAGTPFWKREEIIETYGDLLCYSCGFNLRYGKVDPTEWVQFNTTEDILRLARTTANRVGEGVNNGKYTGVLLPGGIMEELAYLEFYRRTGVLDENEVATHTQMLLQYRDKIGLAVVTLLSPTTALSRDVLNSIDYNEPDEYGIYKLARKERRIMNEDALAELNNCFIDTISDHGNGFFKVHLVDLRDLELPFNDERVATSMAKGVLRGLGKVYPLPTSFPLSKYNSRIKTPLVK